MKLFIKIPLFKVAQDEAQGDNLPQNADPLGSSLPEFPVPENEAAQQKDMPVEPDLTVSDQPNPQEDKEHPVQKLKTVLMGLMAEDSKTDKLEDIKLENKSEHSTSDEEEE